MKLFAKCRFALQPPYGRARAQARAEPSWDLKKYRNLLLDLSISGTSEEKFAGGYIYGSALVLEFLLSEFKNAHYVKFCFTNAILSKSALLKHMTQQGRQVWRGYQEVLQTRQHSFFILDLWTAFRENPTQTAVIKSLTDYWHINKQRHLA